ncbi:S41 family peptidase [Inhella proteolytica]|uniref:S41 family peptidase n=1 Tax=Inhella proteolytica TaxID=2795029 RepID=A0A931NHI2_9BURK|nr:S41 family peptidase [Inhella proteolytica]MBH9577084.1 S41 family peptidase [Inhella proteolytica]
MLLRTLPRACAPLLAAFSLCVLSACGSGDAPAPPPPPPTLEGVWEFPGYGSLLQVAREAGGWRLTHYETTRAACRLGFEPQPMGSAEAAQRLRLSADGQAVEWLEPGQTLTPGRPGRRMAALPAACQGSRWLRAGEPGYQADALREFDWVWSSFDELYHDFRLSGTDWAAQRQALRGRLNAQSSEAQLFEVLAELVAPLGDGHSALFLGEQVFAKTRKPMLPERLAALFLEKEGLSEPLSPPQQEAQATFVGEAQQALIDLPFAAAPGAPLQSRANSLLRWQRRADGLVLVQLLGLSGLAGDADDLARETPVLQASLDELMRDAQGARGMILDLRFNVGGYDEHAVRLASRFSAAPRHLAYSKQARSGEQRTPLHPVYLEPQGALRFDGPVAVLTSSTTFSAAEVLALALRSLPQVRLIGERSGGALSDVLPRHTGGQLLFGLSNEIYLSPQGEWFEAQGVPVHIDVPLLSPAALEAQRDAGLERAVQWLLTGR